MKMKTIALVFSALALAPLFSAQAAWKSAEAIQIEQAKADALIQGKKVLIDIGAGWCPPCAMLDRFFEERAAELKPALDRYIVVKVEELHLELNYVTDYLAHENFDFPNIYLADPVTGKEDIINLDPDFPQPFIDKLNLFSEGHDLSEFAIAEYRKAYQAGQVFTFDSIFTQALGSTALTKPATEFAKLVNEIRSDALAHPEQFDFTAPGDLEGFIFPRFYDMVAGRKDFDLASVQAIDPKAFTDFSGPYSTFYGYVYYFQTQLGRALRQGGIEQAANDCESFKAQADAHYSGRDYYDWGSAPTARTLVCTELQYLAGKITKTQALEKFEAIDATERDGAAKRSSGLLAILGEYARATEYLEKSRAKYSDVYKSNKLLLDRILLAYDLRKAAYEAGKTHP